MWDWLVVGGLGGGVAMFWPIVSRACTNCWTGSIALVDSCTETGGDCCRVGGVHELHDGGGCKDGVSTWPLKSSVTGSVFQGFGIKHAFRIQPFMFIIAWIPFD